MIVTLYLITANVYNSVKAPPSRGFSYIEVWMLGAQAPILIAILEYGAVLHMKKYARKQKTSPTMVTRQKMAFQQEQYETLTLDDKIKMVDYVTFVLSFVGFVCFATIYWAALH